MDRSVEEPALSRNPISIAGAAITTAGAVAFIVYVLLEAFGWLTGPYSGLFGYLLAPVIFVFGLLLIPFGMWREGRRRRRGKTPWRWPVIDVGRKRTRQVVAAVVVLTIVNLGLVALASVGVVHYTESNQFCGQVCHTPMTPQFTAHAASAHSRVNCVSCHVGPGASGFVTAKMNGTRQLYEAVRGTFSRPIPEPIGRIPTAVDTCANCHTPGRPERDLVRTLASYGDDEKNTESTTTLTMQMRANHWHARADVLVEYIATEDTRETIPWIRVTTGGRVTEYFADGITAQPSGTVVRMDCLDCHNRPAHTFSASPDRVVDGAIAAGGASRDLPFVRREMIAALNADYPSHTASDAGIAKHLGDFYRNVPGAQAAELPRAIATTQRLYRQNVFPEMKVTWGTYLSKLGHTDSPGCFRCHDENHKTRDGKAAVRQDCELCHKIQ
jgi:hypothetical protein